MSFSGRMDLSDFVVCCQRVLTEGISFNGRMDLSDSAEHTFCLLENYGAQGSDAPDQPRHVYFARWVTSVLSL